MKEDLFKCRCQTRAFENVLGEYGSNPTSYFKCPDGSDPYKDDFEADSALVSWLTESTLGLWKKVGGQSNDTLQRMNICNQGRQADIATLYLARALGLSVSNIISTFVFDETKAYIFPNSSSKPNIIYSPNAYDLFYRWPKLDQTFWTIMSQYNSQTEPQMRTRDKSTYWCWIVGLGMYDHCIQKTRDVSCDQTTANHETMCNGYWKYFVEACHRVHSINPAQGGYNVYQNNGQQRNPNWICNPSKTNFQLYQISRM